MLSDPYDRLAQALFDAATACAYVNGEPGFINGDRLEDARTGFARAKPATAEAGSARYRVEEGATLLEEVARRAATTHFPVTTNPCGEVVLHVTGGYCVIADFAPLLASTSTSPTSTTSTTSTTTTTAPPPPPATDPAGTAPPATG